MRLPRSLLFFAATAIAFLLQLFPYTGVFLMVLGAPFWSVILINLGFIGVGAEAAAGKVGKGWMILPIAWFVGYAGYALGDHQILWNLKHQIATSNADVLIPFDPSRQALVFEGSISGNWLVNNYALPVVYRRSDEEGEWHYRSTRLVDRTECDRIRRDKSLRGTGISVFGFHDRDGLLGSGKFETRFCDMGQPEDPILPVALVRRSESNRIVSGLPVTDIVTTVALPDGSVFSLSGGHAAPLGWIPKLVMGCALNSAAPSWDCTAGFVRDRFTQLNDTDLRYGSDDIVLARALGLKPVAPSDRQAGDPKQVRADTAAALKRVLDEQTANLDRALRDPGAQIGSVPFPALRGRMDIILPRLDAMVLTVERGVELRHNARSNAQQIFHLIMQAPADEIAPYRARLEALKTKDNWFVFAPNPIDVRAN
ncbi:hypothetical protein EOA32_34095 [Mesorhizobium sp. M1A.F.Ca.ET.072.01.1.1]|uniref:hypothetical protein n=1 Tax=Mesorhizobium sp. M1A.F.Ca.ET.072.01.1.1 TaxID=2496753 RepID=UPI000FD43C29|nr:hypothetical protein [Mesorhizobium sp. M1A.F.Ca.ET.072.01.1.1]RUW45440.1 hypothetical protein EOA32_34095 [Mesorhizobium sp. M1A.F.Ca.ET.072.01.1.1]